mgnify:CR=1 FL=1
MIEVLALCGLGVAASWAIALYYYRRTKKDAADALFAQRLDSCNAGDKTFLVAMLDAQDPIPLYACINVEFETQEGRKDGWGSNTLIMNRSVDARVKHCTRRHSGNRIDEDRTTVSLTGRGRENAEYLLRKEYKKAWFSMIDDSDEIRLGLFRTEHKREPRKAG